MPVSCLTADMATVEMSRLDSIPTATLNKLLELAENADAIKASILPTVKSADNGKVLTVVSGKWAAAEIPGETAAD